MYLFFDTETNGLPRRGAKMEDVVKNPELFPRVIQLAWELYDENQVLQSKECHLIKPDGWTIPHEKFWIENGFATHISEQYGRPMRPVLMHFINDMQRAKIMIAHNMDFDGPIVAAEMVRAGLKSQNKPIRLCTMKTNVDRCRIPQARGSGFKWPTLHELHMHLFGTGFDGAHDAGADVAATAKCYFETYRLFKDLDNKIMPQVNAALNELRTIDKNDLSEF